MRAWGIGVLVVVLAACSPHRGAQPSGTPSTTTATTTVRSTTSMPAPTTSVRPATGNDFVTPDGVACSDGYSGLDCVGALPGVPPGVNMVRLAPYRDKSGYYRLGTVVRADGARRLEVGQEFKSTSGLVCMVSPGPRTECVQGRVSLTIGAGKTVVRDGDLVLPEGVPNPLAYVRSDIEYDGHGPKGIERKFTVANGLQCSILTYSGGRLGCVGPLPGLGNGAVSVSSLPEPDGIGIGAINPPDGQVQDLPVGDRVYGYGDQGVCMAVADGVACGFFGTTKSRGFVAANGRTWMFGDK